MLALVETNASKSLTSGHAKLRAIWDAKAKELGLTQAIAAEQMGMSAQSSVSQYLNGSIPLNLGAALKFAQLLRVEIDDIWEGDLDASLSTEPLAHVKQIAKNRLSYSQQLDLQDFLLQLQKERLSEGGAD